MNERSLIKWVVLVVAVIALLNLPPSLSNSVKALFRETARPLQLAVDAVFGSAWEYMRGVGRLNQILAERRNLELEVARLQSERNMVRQLEAENAELRRLLNFAPPARIDWIAAEVLSRSNDGWWQTIRLNKGSADGIGEQMAVVSMEGLVGKTVAVSRNTADVLLLSDPACKVSARLVRTGSFGVVSGRGPSWQGQVFCRMEFIHRSDELKTGDEVVTTGLGGIFPPNIPIGYIDRVFTDATGLYQHADVITRAELGALRHVFVLKYGGANDGGPGG